MRSDAQYNADSGVEDFAPDFEWEVATLTDANGWTAEFRVPFATLRYPRTSDGVWAVLAFRNYPRENTHGNSKNIVRAAEFAKARGMKVFGFLGMGGGALAPVCDSAVIVPSSDYGPIEDAHMIFDHLITAYFHKWLNPNKA